jgi:hypothetical protein
LNSQDSLSSNSQVFLVLTLALLIALYTLGRFGEHWSAGGDTARFTEHIRAMLETNTIQPFGASYQHGYGYQVLAVFLSHIGDIPLVSQQTIGSALFIAWLVIPAWLLYRELTTSQWAATLATVIILIQPEFTFAIMRGTHERFTRGMMILCLFLLVRSIRARIDLKRFTGYILAFYLTAFALISFNSTHASSLLLSMALSLVFAWTALRLRRHRGATLRPALSKLSYAVIGALLLTFVFIFYIYTPARDALFLFDRYTDRLAVTLLDVETAPNTASYGVVVASWLNLPVYFTLSLPTWTLLGASVLIWLVQTMRWFLRGRSPENESQLLLWAFFGAFAAIGAISVLIDLGATLADNLQVRSFPSFAMLAAPLVAGWLLKHASNINRQWLGGLARNALWMGIGLLAVLSTLKVTNEPLLSNRWPFSTAAEMQGLIWVRGVLPDRAIWTDYDERLKAAFIIRSEAVPSSFDLDIGGVKPATRDILVSDVTVLRSQRFRIPLPVEADSLMTYDNGKARIYHLRPRTPYQR